MDKYGVEESPQDKTASPTDTCPDCGSTLCNTDVTGVLVCPECGTKPFEQPEVTKKNSG